jgi:hypothetical protein
MSPYWLWDLFVAHTQTAFTLDRLLLLIALLGLTFVADYLDRQLTDAEN